ncbi:MAG: hypothetical protein ACI9LM_000314 [Alteromonadaceae bacterium]|jgi:hypothetical protein
MFKITTLSFLFILSVFSVVGQEITGNATLNEEQMIFDLPTETLSDADILQSLNEVVNQIDSEISTIEAQNKFPTNKETTPIVDKNLTDLAINITNDNKSFDSSSFLIQEILDDKAYENDMDLIDSFDDMEFEGSFNESELGDEQITKALFNNKTTENITTSTTKVLPDDLTIPFDSSYSQNKVITSQAVGIDSDDEKTINSLDNSDLMDYIKESDLWSEDMIDDDIEIELYD